MRTAALSIAGACIVGIGVALMLSDIAMSDPKTTLSPGDRVMLVAPDGDGFSWQGPYEIVDSDRGQRMVISTNNGDVVTDSTQVMPLQVWNERAKTTNRGEH